MVGDYWRRCDALLEYGLGLLAVAAGALAATLLVGGVVGLGALLLIARS